MDYTSTLLTPDNLTLIISNLILVILFIVAAYFGARLKWYQDLPKKSSDNTYILAAAWIIASILSYVSFYLIKDEDDSIYGYSRLIAWYALINFLNLLWVVIFYIYQSFIGAIVILLIISFLTFYIFLFFLAIHILAGVFILPLLILYVYLIYTLINLASRNAIII